MQRIPPTEKYNRRQTSVVSVGIMDEYKPGKFKLSDDQIDIKAQIGRQKAGGQKVNKTSSAIRMKHEKTGIEVFIQGRSQKKNKEKARKILEQRVSDHYNNKNQSKYDKIRKDQVADCGRSDKTRTYNFIKGFIQDHKTNKTIRDIKGFMKGKLGIIYE